MKLLGVFVAILVIHGIAASPLLGGLLNGLTGTLSKTTSQLTDVVSNVGQGLTGSLSVLGGLLSNIGKILANLIESVADALGSVCASRNRGCLCQCGKRFGPVVKSVKSLQGNAGQNIKTLSRSLRANFNIINDFISNLGELDEISTMITSLLRALEGNLQTVLKVTSKTPVSVINSSFASVIYGVAVLIDAIDSITSVANFISSTLNEAVANAVAALTLALSTVLLLVETVVASVAAVLGRAITDEVTTIVLAVSGAAQAISNLVRNLSILSTGTLGYLSQITATLSATLSSLTSAVGDIIDVVPAVTGALSGLATSFQLIISNLCCSLDIQVAASQYQRIMFQRATASSKTLLKLEARARSKLSIALTSSARSFRDIGGVINGIADSGSGILAGVASILQSALDICANLADPIDIASLTETVASAFEVIFLAGASLSDILSSDVMETILKAVFTFDNALSELLAISMSFTCGDDISTIINFAAANVAGALNALITIVTLTVENASTVVARTADDVLASALAALSLILSTTLALGEGVLIIVSTTLQTLAGSVIKAIDTLAEAVDNAVDSIANAISPLRRIRGSVRSLIPKLSASLTKILSGVVDNVRSLTGDVLKISGSCSKSIKPVITVLYGN